MVGLASLATTLGGACVAFMLQVVLEDPSALTPSELRRVGADDWQVAFEGTADAAQVFTLGNDRLAPLVEEPHVLLLCDAYGCPVPLETELYEASIGDRTNLPQRAFRGIVFAHGNIRPRDEAGGYDPAFCAAVGEYARRRGYAVDDLVVIQPTSVHDPFVAFVVVLALALCVSLALWSALAWHWIASRREVPLPRAADFETKSAVWAVLLTMLTARIYQLVWLYTSTSQIRRLTGRRDLVPLLDLVLTIVTFRLWSAWVFYRNAEAVDDALTDLGEPPARTISAPIAASSIFCGAANWFLIYSLQESVNRLVRRENRGPDSVLAVAQQTGIVGG